VITTWINDLTTYQTGEIRPRTFTVTCKDGMEKSINFMPVQIAGGQQFMTCEDISDRKKMVEALQQSENLYRTLIDNSLTGIYMIQKGHYVFINDMFYKITGYSWDELKSKHPLDLIVPEKQNQMRTILQKRLAGEEVPSEYETQMLRKDGSQIDVQVRAALILFENQPTILGNIIDITERKRTEHQMIFLQEQLRQSQKIEAIGRLAGGVAHDFNNLLTVILGTSELLLLELEKESPLRESIEDIKRTAERAATLTHQLLAFSRRQVMEFQVLDLNDVLRNLEKMLRRIIGEDIELITSFAGDLGKIKADPNQIEQILMNLVVNAKDAMPQGGRLIIETENAELDEEYSHSHVGVKPGRYVRLSISDTGIGMPPELKEKVFEPFFTTKEKGKGTGLGLSTVYGIVKQSGGNIWVYSEPMKGTTIKIYLPRAFEPLEENKEQLEMGESPFGNETILVVEDEEEVRKLAVQILEKHGYQVLKAQDGDEALALCENYRGPIHLILTDVVMPGMGGRELVHHLHELHLESKVVYMSGYTDNAIVHHGILEKGINYIQKPFTIEGLLRKIWEVLHR
jgi:PAS domain S-box-containing protein